MWLAQREHSRRELQDKLQRWVQALEATQGLTTAARRLGEDGDDLAPASTRSISRSSPLAGTESSATSSSVPRPALPDASQIAALLDDLEAAGHLSNERVLESRIQVRSARFGNLRIERELQHLGVEPSNEARSTLRSTELARARSVWERKFGAAPASAAERARQMRFLAARGFTAETIRAVLSPRSQDIVDDDGFP
jgi:regulatory protein